MKKLIVAMAALALMATSAYAAEWDFYGSATVDTFWSDDDQNAGTDNVDTQIQADLIGSGSVIGANVKVSDELTGRFEYANANANAVSLRHIYGEWNFGAGSLIVGQTDGAFDTDISTQVFDDGHVGTMGCADTGRAPLVKFVFGGLKFNIEAPELGIVTGAAAPVTTTSEATLPQINASYTFTLNNISIELGGAYQTYEYEPVAGGTEFDVTSYVVGAQFGATLGAFNLAASIFGGENAANLVGVDTAVDTTSYTAARSEGYAYYDGAKVYDAESFGFALVGSYTINEMFAISAGYGYAENTVDVAAGTVSEDDEACTYYVNLPITLAPGVVITPEIGVVDYEEALTTEDTTTYFGARWKISF